MTDQKLLLNELRLRTFQFERAETDGETFPVVLSTDAPVDMGGYEEILEHTAAAIDLSRAPLPLIDSHKNTSAPYGVAERLHIANGKLRGVVRFGNSQRARELMADVKAGVLRSVSIAYKVLKHHLAGGRVIVTRWQPYELSAVAAPADPGAGFFRSLESTMQANEERERAAGIVRAGHMYDDDSGVLAAVEGGESLSAFRSRVMLKAATRPAALGLSRSELKRYSLTRGLRSLAEPPHARERTLEWEVHDEIARLQGEPRNLGILYIPPDIAYRDLTAGSPTAGGHLVGAENLPSWVELARPRSVALSLGVELLSGLASNLTIARESAGPTITWLSTEATQAAESTPELEQIALGPKTAGAYVEFSRQLLLQSNPSVERFATRTLLSATGVAVDVAVLNGSGVSGQPLGLIGTAGIGTFSGTTLALAGVLGAQADIGNNLSPNCGYATTRAVAQLLAAREKVATSGQMLWAGNLYEGELGGYRSMTSGNIPTGHLIFGDWPSILLASWGTLAVEVNPFANFAAGIIGARVLHSLDVGVLRPAAFSIATSVT